VADRGDHQAADRVVLVVGEVGAEAFVEILDRRQCVDHVAAVGLRCDLRVAIDLVLVVLVVDLADDLLQDVLDRHQAGHAAVLVDHDRHVVARKPELLEQDVEALGFRNHHRGPDELRQRLRRGVLGERLQQVLGQQDAEDLVALLAIDREPGVTAVDDDLQHLVQAEVDRQRDHLRARDHHVADLLLGHRDRALDHRQCVGRQQAAGLGFAQAFEQVFAVARLTGEDLADAIKPGALFRRGGTSRFLGHLLGAVAVWREAEV